MNSLKRIDWIALLIVVLLLVVGEVMIYSSYEASAPTGTLWENAVFRQGVFAAIGLLIYLAAALTDYHIWIELYRIIYVFVILILVATLLLGSARGGAQSWFEFSSFDVQPSELSKVLMILVLAKVLSVGDAWLESAWPFFTSLGLLLPLLALIYLQPDFGTAVILAAGWLGIVFLSGVRWRHILLVGIIAAAAAPLVWFRLDTYMQGRIVNFLLPNPDPSGESYNINQALISIGSGGWWGKGLLQGTQTQLHFLRVRHTDFIFSVIAEELGFVGAIAIIILFLILVLRLARTARMARDKSGRLIAVGVCSTVLVQTFINMGMNANLLPVTGLPLPLISYGGSSLITTLLALGLAQSVAAQRPTQSPRLVQ